VYRWRIDASTGRWADPESLAGHSGAVVDVEVDPSGRSLFTQAVDHTVIRWDMGALGRADAAVPEASSRLLAHLCAVVARDFTSAEWRRLVPARPWQPTCTDLR
jgi:hypothetical protein